MQFYGLIMTKNEKKDNFAVWCAQRKVSEIYNISESIETIGSIIDELSMDEKKIAEFREQYLKIARRSRDPNFYLSAIGDFSSGKSTLINTIIKRKLLKVVL